MAHLDGFNRTLWGNIYTNVASTLFGQARGESDWLSPPKIQFEVRVDR
jgi:hypothetical protein